MNLILENLKSTGRKTMNNEKASFATHSFRRLSRNERGAALATSLIILTLLGAISMTVLAVVTHESRIAGSDLQRTQTFYAAAAGIEKMTSDFSNAFSRSSNPDLTGIPNGYPTELTGEGFSFVQSL